jgi:hypothetical protein
MGSIDDGVVRDRHLHTETAGRRDRGMIRHLLPAVRTRRRRVNHVHVERVHVHAVSPQAPVHQGELTEDRVARPGVEATRREADRVPDVRVGDVELHQVAVEVRRALRIEVQVDPAGSVTDPNARLDAQIAVGTFEQSQIHSARNLPLDERPPDVLAIVGGVHEDRGRARFQLLEGHPRAAVTSEERPAGESVRRGAQGVEVVTELGLSGRAPYEEEQGDRGGQGPRSDRFHPRSGRRWISDLTGRRSRNTVSS